MTDPTREQELAITTLDRSLLVEAGAGTGKTWVLVERFMHLLNAHPDWPLDAIIAITFTEKAAREMRDRIRRAVERGAARHPDEKIWQQRRLDLDRLRVSTIHSLCAQLLREHAIAAAIDPRFVVLDEEEATLLKEEAIRTTLVELETSSAESLELFASLRTTDVTDEMARLLGQRGTVGRLFDTLEAPGQLLAKWTEGLSEMQSSIWSARCAQDPLLNEALVQLPVVKIVDRSDRLAGAVVAGQEGCRLHEDGNLAAAIASWLTINLTGGRQANWGGSSTLKELKAHLKALRDAAKVLDNAGATMLIDEQDEQAAADLQRWGLLWEILDQRYAQLKEDQHALDFDDLEILTYRLLTGPDQRDERVDAYLSGIQQLMVDEFQDTNETQREIVYALAPPASGHLFVVGDAKQSIYRFRQAQVSILHQTAIGLKALTGSEPNKLSRSFRTHHALVEAGNYLFEQLLQPMTGTTYADYEARPGALNAARPAPSHLSTPVELTLLPAKNLQGDTISAEDGRIWEAQLLAERLLELKRGGFNVWDKEQEAYRPFRFGDAAILFRATTRLPLYEEQFKTLGLPYLTVSGRGYYSRPEVLDLIAWLAALYNPFDDFNLAVALRSPLFGLSDETLYRLRLHDEQGAPVSEPKPLWKALQSPPPSDQTGQVARANQVRIRLARMVDRCDVWTLLHTTIEETAYSAILAAADAQNAGGRQLRNVQKLLSIARDSGMIGLSDFLHRVDDLRAAEAREGEATGREPESGAVQLMSIHAAKGLEFPVLAVADLGRPARGHAAPQILHDPVFGLACKGRDEWGDWIKPAGYRWAEWLDGCMEEAESRRLLYVACTRAADLLLLSGKAGGKNTWLQTILAAWQVDVEGEEQEEIELDGYGLRVMRPVAAPESRSRQRSAGRSHPGLTEIPDLVAPLQPTESQPTISVTQLVRQISTVDAEPPRLQAVVRAQSSARQRRAPSYILGQVTHRVLAEWDLFYSDEVDQGGMVREISAAQGVERDTISDLVDTIVNILRRIRRDDLFAEIQSATSRYHEMPFSLTRPAEVLHGQIDLLFQDDHSGWTLVDWKTDWVTDGEQDRHIEQHGPQMALYTAAVEELLGVRPRALICLLCPRVNVYEYNDDELAGHMAQLGLS